MGETKAPLVENTRLREEEPGHRAQILAEVVTICLDLVSFVTPSSDNPEDAMHMFFLIKFIPLGVSGTPHKEVSGAAESSEWRRWPEGQGLCRSSALQISREAQGFSSI